MAVHLIKQGSQEESGVALSRVESQTGRWSIGWKGYSAIAACTTAVCALFFYNALSIPFSTGEAAMPEDVCLVPSPLVVSAQAACKDPLQTAMQVAAPLSLWDTCEKLSNWGSGCFSANEIDFEKHPFSLVTDIKVAPLREETSGWGVSEYLFNEVTNLFNDITNFIRSPSSEVKEKLYQFRAFDGKRNLQALSTDLFKIVPKHLTLEEVVNLIFEACRGEDIPLFLDAIQVSYPLFILSPYNQIRRVT